jgi:pyruvate ferredoxin oxidoreductase gamma subunit
MMTEIRLHGRGGQGIVTAANTIVEAGVLEGKYVQGFPEFGSERSGAPVSAYVRISEEPIETNSFIYNPKVVLVFDKTMVFSKTTSSGLEADGYFICNHDGEATELRRKLGLSDTVKVISIDATGLALKTLGRDIPNSPMLGVLVKATGVVKFDSVSKILGERFKGAVRDGNVEALRLGYEGVKLN